MASFFNNNNDTEVPDPNSKPSTTFVQTDPSNFRALVQRLTGATTLHQPSRHAGKPTLPEIGRRRSGYKLHERRKTVRKLEISLETVARRPFMSPAATKERSLTADGDEIVMASPVSTLDVGGEGSCPGTPMEDEEKAIAEKGFYLHPSPIRGSEPELLVLFPLHSPKNDPAFSS